MLDAERPPEVAARPQPDVPERGPPPASRIPLATSWSVPSPPDGDDERAAPARRVAGEVDRVSGALRALQLDGPEPALEERAHLPEAGGRRGPLRIAG